MHKEYTLRAFQAGKHVICEKPLAMNAQEAAEMVAAGKKANRQLFVGYRLHYEPHHREAIRLCQTEAFGKIKFFEGGFGFRIGNPNQWRFHCSGPRVTCSGRENKRVVLFADSPSRASRVSHW